MDQRNKAVVSVIIVAIVVGSGLLVYEHQAGAGTSRGQVITVSSGYNLSRPLSRIVSLDPAATATIYAIGGFNKLVGGNSYDAYPPNNLTNVTDYPRMNMAQIFNLSPQAVIAFSDYPQSQVSQLLNNSIDYIFLNAGANSTLTSVEKQNTLLGQITGETGNASRLNTWMNTSMEKLNETSYNASQSQGVKKGFYYLSSGGGIWTAGNTTFINEDFTYAHISNIASNYSNTYYPINPEEISNEPPQVIFLDPYVNASYLNKAPFSNTPAVKDNMTFTIPSDSIFSEPNFRDIYAIQWMIYSAYNVTVNLPRFPFNLKYSPNPTGI